MMMDHKEIVALLHDIAHTPTGDDHWVTFMVDDAPEVLDPGGVPFQPEGGTIMYSRELEEDAESWTYMSRITLLLADEHNRTVSVREVTYTSADRKKLVQPWVVALMHVHAPSWFPLTFETLPVQNQRPRRLAVVK